MNPFIAWHVVILADIRLRCLYYDERFVCTNTELLLLSMLRASTARTTFASLYGFVCQFVTVSRRRRKRLNSGRGQMKDQ